MLSHAESPLEVRGQEGEFVDVIQISVDIDFVGKDRVEYILVFG